MSSQGTDRYSHSRSEATPVLVKAVEDGRRGFCYTNSTLEAAGAPFYMSYYFFKREKGDATGMSEDKDFDSSFHREGRGRAKLHQKNILPSFSQGERE